MELLLVTWKATLAGNTCVPCEDLMRLTQKVVARKTSSDSVEMGRSMKDYWLVDEPVE